MKSCNANRLHDETSVPVRRGVAALNNPDFLCANPELVSLGAARASSAGLPAWLATAFGSPPCWLSGSGPWCRTVGDAHCADQA